MLKTLALIFGVVFLAIGVAGFFVLNPAGPGSTGGNLTMNHGEGVLLGLFPVNTLHNAAHVLFGLWGLAASRTVGSARGYFRGVAIGYGLLTILGLIPQTNTFFGLIPLHGNDVWLHAVLALVGAYLGFMHRERSVDVR
jgi:hypothetical protein